MTNRIIIVRGLPGSGKTTLAKDLEMRFFQRKERDKFGTLRQSSVHCVAADDYFTDAEGNYEFNPSRLSEAHLHCGAKLLLATAMMNHRAVTFIQHNTNIRYYELAPYVQTGLLQYDEVHIVELKLPISKSIQSQTHGVPEWKIGMMAADWEEIPKFVERNDRVFVHRYWGTKIDEDNTVAHIDSKEVYNDIIESTGR
tara:strand:- start:94475 stop:95068 length:594 start_codon:yes stop_codon:yes gene_type:complete